MNRILLEASQHADNAFITLTYSDEISPNSFSLIPEHLTLWLKSLRKAIAPARVRYYAVGEYGTKNQRPHYHVILFGYPNCLRGATRLGLKEEFVNEHIRCCPSCDLIYDTWRRGGIYVGAVESKSAQYVAQYVMKKMTSMNDPRLNGRWPEFSRMSLRPGLGKTAMFDVANELMKYNLENTLDDVPVVLRHGKKMLPLGRYLRRQLRTMIGRSPDAPEGALKKQQEEMLVLQILAKNSTENPSLKSQVKLSRITKNLSAEAREQIFKSKGKL